MNFARRIGWYFMFLGIAVLAIALILALGQQPSFRTLLMGLGSTMIGLWFALRAARSAALLKPPPPPPPAPAAAKAKGGFRLPLPSFGKKKPSPPPPPPPPPPQKPKGLAALFARKPKQPPPKK
ncbi:MAG: hypothetical protein HY260_16975 [Chloroflexi bacterium]|nr:hypothetical protein [Chloroflexota bacterium]